MKPTMFLSALRVAAAVAALLATGCAHALQSRATSTLPCPGPVTAEIKVQALREAQLAAVRLYYGNALDDPVVGGDPLRARFIADPSHFVDNIRVLEEAFDEQAKTYSVSVIVELNDESLRVAMAGLSTRQPPTASIPIARPADQYPWDNRPLKCFTTPTPTWLEVCKPPVSFGSFDETIGQVGMLFDGENLELVRRAAQKLALSGEKFSTGEYHFEAWYAAMRRQFDYGNETGARIATDWTARKGVDGFDTLASAMVQHGYAWQARGSGYARTHQKPGNSSTKSWKPPTRC